MRDLGRYVSRQTAGLMQRERNAPRETHPLVTECRLANPDRMSRQDIEDWIARLRRAADLLGREMQGRGHSGWGDIQSLGREIGVMREKLTRIATT